ncbi:MAG: hypothetical protein JSR66_13580 [Proteobacteria bacterium]|nr:hypothetical protein [Pseudomonadota bacterium]
MSRKRTNTVIPEAVRWFHRFRMEGPTALSPDESANWARWSADPGNLAEFRRANRLWKDLQALSGIARPTPAELSADNYDPSKPVSEWLTRGKRKKPKR